jgi:hypothetical protein
MLLQLKILFSFTGRIKMLMQLIVQNSPLWTSCHNLVKTSYLAPSLTRLPSIGRLHRKKKEWLAVIPALIAGGGGDWSQIRRQQKNCGPLHSSSTVNVLQKGSYVTFSSAFSEKSSLLANPFALFLISERCLNSILLSYPNFKYYVQLVLSIVDTLL